jgi:hypothetical protein
MSLAVIRCLPFDNLYGAWVTLRTASLAKTFRAGTALPLCTARCSIRIRLTGSTGSLAFGVRPCSALILRTKLIKFIRGSSPPERSSVVVATHHASLFHQFSSYLFDVVANMRLTVDWGEDRLGHSFTGVGFFSSRDWILRGSFADLLSEVSLIDYLTLFFA